MCEKHNKPCSYLRPTKRRGPQKGYRTALNTYKESAAAWGVVLGAIPGLDALIEGHLRSENGRFLLKSVKDPAQQDALIQKWQQSTVFKSFFPSSSTTASIEGEEAEEPRDSVLEMDPFPVPRGKPYAPKLSPSRTSRSSFGPADIDLTRRRRSVTAPQQPVIREPTSLSDIVAKDAARSYVPSRPFYILCRPTNPEADRLMPHKRWLPSVSLQMRQLPIFTILALIQNKSSSPLTWTTSWARMRSRESTTSCSWAAPLMTRPKGPKPSRIVMMSFTLRLGH